MHSIKQYDTVEYLGFYLDLNSTEPVTGGVLKEKVLLKVLRNSEENTCPRVSFFHRTPVSNCF